MNTYMVQELHTRHKDLCCCRGDKSYELGSLTKHKPVETVTFVCFNCQRKVELTRKFKKLPPATTTLPK